MRVVKTDNLLAALPTFPLDADQVPRIDVVAIVRRVRPSVAGAGTRSHDAFVAIHPAEQYTAAFVRIGLLAVPPESVILIASNLQHPSVPLSLSS
jgi:hypothetical protein